MRNSAAEGRAPLFLPFICNAPDRTGPVPLKTPEQIKGWLMAEAEKETRAETPVQHFRRVVVGPLVRMGMRKPRNFTAEEWDEALDGIGADFGGRSTVELEAVRKALRDCGVGARGATWPKEIVLRRLIHAALTKRRADTGSDSEADAFMVERALKWWRERGTAPPAGLYNLKRRNVLVKILGSEDGPSVADLLREGHQIPDDLRALYSGAAA